jgi:hypothetical protein
LSASLVDFLRDCPQTFSGHVPCVSLNIKKTEL